MHLLVPVLVGGSLDVSEKFTNNQLPLPQTSSAPCPSLPVPSSVVAPAETLLCPTSVSTEPLMTSSQSQVAGSFAIDTSGSTAASPPMLLSLQEGQTSTSRLRTLAPSTRSGGSPIVADMSATPTIPRATGWPARRGHSSLSSAVATLVILTLVILTLATPIQPVPLNGANVVVKDGLGQLAASPEALVKHRTSGTRSAYKQWLRA
jgi:hypothetical protein